MVFLNGCFTCRNENSVLGLLLPKKTRHCCVENLHTFLKYLTYKYALEINVIDLIKFPLKIKTKTLRANKLSFKLDFEDVHLPQGTQLLCCPCEIPACLFPDMVQPEIPVPGHTGKVSVKPTSCCSPSGEQAHPEAWRPAMAPFGQQRALHTLLGLHQAAKTSAALPGLGLFISIPIWTLQEAGARETRGPEERSERVAG